jgi:integrative and conjugative element protein (TIGR02256 family)
VTGFAPAKTVLLAESAAATLARLALRAHPNETGGILLGVRNATRPWITHAIEIPSTDRGRSHYRLPAGTTTAAVARARETDPRLGYLGEWHSHPSDVGPSSTDRATMRRLALRHPRTGLILIVVRRRDGSPWLDLREMTFPLLHRREATPTGDLPQEPATGIGEGAGVSTQVGSAAPTPGLPGIALPPACPSCSRRFGSAERSRRIPRHKASGDWCPGSGAAVPQA